MIDLKWLREHPDAFDRALARRGQPPAAAAVLTLDAARRALETRLQEDQATRNRLSREIGQRSAKGERPAPELLAEMTRAEGAGQAGRGELRELQATARRAAADFPNVLADDVPDGPDESHNVELRRWGNPRDFAFDAAAARRAGRGAGHGLRRAPPSCPARGSWCCGASSPAWSGRSAQFMLDLQTREHGYTEVAVPYLVRDEALFGTGQLPKFADDLFRTNERPLADPDRRGLADQPGRRRDPRRERACRCASPR